MDNTIESQDLNTTSKKAKIIKIIIAIVYYGIVIGTEFAYREELFNKSVEVEEEIQLDLSSITIKLFKLISFLGTIGFTLPTLVIIFLFLPLNSTYLYLCALIYSSYFTNLMKMFYHNPRPFWVNDNISISCNLGFGNPSGHSFTSFAVFLSFSHLITNFNLFKRDLKGKIIRGVIFIVFIAIIILILTSRVVLGAHGINQVLYGGLLGIGLYFVLFHIVEYHIYGKREFYTHFNDIKIIILSFTINIILFIIALVSFFVIKVHTNEYELVIINKCGVKKKYQMFLNDAFYQTCGIFGLIGGKSGMLIMFKIVEMKYKGVERYIICWNWNSGVKEFFIRLPILIVCSIGIILTYVVPGTSPISVIFVFKSSLAFFIGMFGAFCLGIYFSIYCQLANKNIYINSNPDKMPKIIMSSFTTNKNVTNENSVAIQIPNVKK